jgi:quercetin dioxygenase-like cupin family protein
MGKMRLRRNFIAVTLIASFVPGAYGQNSASIIKLPDLSGIQIPLHPGQLAVRHLIRRPHKVRRVRHTLEIRAGRKGMPHWHPDEVRTATVLSGTYYFAIGEQWDESKFRAFPAGTFISEPPNTPHYAWAKDGDVIVQFTGVGPTGTTMIPQKAQ